MIFVNVLSYILVLIGGLNWGLYGLLNFNLVGWIFQGPRTVGSIIIYTLVALAALWLIISPMVTSGILYLRSKDKEEKRTADQQG